MKLSPKQKELKKSLDKDIKMVICVRSDLDMKKGKMISQGSHGTLKLYKQLLKNDNPLLDEWEINGTKKIAVKVENQRKLHDIRLKAEQMDVPYAIIQDAGRTQVEAGSETVIVVFGESKKIDQITGKLKLIN